MKSKLPGFFILVWAAFLAACGATGGNVNSANASNTGAGRAAVETEVRGVMDEFAAALNKGDAGALDKLYTDDYVLVDQDGVLQSKAARIEAIRSGKLKFEDLKFSDLRIKPNTAGDSAVIVGRVAGKTVIDGNAVERDSIVTWVLGKTKDKGWQFINAQITDMKDPPRPGHEEQEPSHSDDDKAPRKPVSKH